MVLLRNVGVHWCLLVTHSLLEKMYLYLYGGEEIFGICEWIINTNYLLCLVIKKRKERGHLKLKMWGKLLSQSNKNKKRKKYISEP